MSFSVGHGGAFCNLCEHVQKWSDRWWYFSPGSKYYPQVEPEGTEFSIYACPLCVQALSRDAKRETRFASHDEVAQLTKEFWLAEVAYAIRRAKQLWNKWESSQQQMMNVMPPPPPPEDICVPDDDDDMEL